MVRRSQRIGYPQQAPLDAAIFRSMRQCSTPTVGNQQRNAIR
jgi:hypothetical protein